ncbi:ATP-binding response regulator [Flavivirga eckloniae]|uniref:histidine kinase n=1 Tax=Flavivirga eckloniae TaxID=1803846 RepID=A0A2K9PW59_9FLAO|nr:ATP-binding protein [Flavivirga eckloniae]AUP81294.1 hybrid sensor histidine kinase/response regulator [Flavivirga eckloniae]
MKYSYKNRITFKVLIGYSILGILATISGFLVLSEIKTFTKKQDISDRNKIIKTGSLIADIYKNENLARAALQLNSSTKFNEYLDENENLLLKIDSLNLMVYDTAQEFILDSIKLIIDKKLNNITDLKNLKHNDNSEESINTAINKLSSIDSLLGKVTLGDLVKNPNALDNKTRRQFEEYVRILNKYNPQDAINNIEQKQIDSLLSISKNMLKDAQMEFNNQRISLQKKERELIENDLTISRKLQELLSNLEKGVILYASNMNKQREKTLNHSKNIILFAAGISFIIIILFSVIILNDFWKAQRYRKKLEQANEITSALLKSREQLISMVSHDLRTPLSTITGFSELLQKSTLNIKNNNYIDHIKSASNYMWKLVDDLLEFSKLENGNISMESVPFNLEKLLGEIVQNAKNIVQDKPINFVVKHDKAINKPIISDPFRMKQILYNLVINAYKFTNKGTITIESSLKQYTDTNMLEISVNDTGIGISKDQKENIFKAFTQAESNEENKQKGFGLGLTISKKLAELLGGKLTLESEVNKGSTFTLKIPITLLNKPLNEPIEAKNESIFNLKAIIVEDDASIQQLLKNLLKQYDIETYVFNNAQTALKTIHDIDYDFVLTDIQLPKMNGLHFMETLKNHKSYNKQPIIAMTGRANISREDYMDSGFSEVLIKPFNSKKIQNVLQEFFSNKPLLANGNTLTNENTKKEGFNMVSIRSFLNYDATAIKNTMHTFLEDTKMNYLQLKEAKKNNDTSLFNSISHKMISMFKLLEVKEIIPFLEVFETTEEIDNQSFIDFEKGLNNFISSLETYLN